MALAHLGVSTNPVTFYLEIVVKYELRLGLVEKAHPLVQIPGDNLILYGAYTNCTS